ncbi:MAG: RNA-binding protein, partial [bacterium]|nr:RNA-binding protein [bacterium]
MNIYVGNLPYTATDNDLRDAFSAFGTVESARVITDKFTGQAKGFGFVEMPSDDEARAAISGMDGKELGGRQIRVNESQPKEQRSGGGGGYGGGGGGHGGGGGGGARRHLPRLARRRPLPRAVRAVRAVRGVHGFRGVRAIHGEHEKRGGRARPPHPHQRHPHRADRDRPRPR